MFGGVFLLSGGSSKAVQQSPPIKAASRGEEDFIQYVLEHHTRHHPYNAHTDRRGLGLTLISRKFLKDAEKDSAGKH